MISRRSPAHEHGTGSEIFTWLSHTSFIEGPVVHDRLSRFQCWCVNFPCNSWTVLIVDAQRLSTDHQIQTVVPSSKKNNETYLFDCGSCHVGDLAMTHTHTHRGFRDST